MELKNQLTDVHKHLEELFAAASKLQNKNFADIVATAKGRLQQLCEHPDLPLVEKELSGGDKPEMPFDPAAGKPVGDAGDNYVPPATAPIGAAPQPFASASTPK